MKKLTWIGTIVWGAFVGGFGLTGLEAGIGTGVGEIEPQDVMFLIAGGMVTCLIGMLGLIGLIGWVPGCAQNKKVIFNVRQRTDQPGINSDTVFSATQSFYH